MSNTKKILVALAFSEYAKGTFTFAADLAGCMVGELIVASIINQRDVESVQTISAMGFDVDGEHYIQTVRSDRERLLEEIVSGVGYPMEKIRTIFRVGNPIDELLKIIVEEEVDIVVMGPKGRTDLENVFVGSVAEKIFRKSPATVISYRSPETYKKLKKRIEHG